MASSIVGTWNTFVDWGDTGRPITANPLTFNADGSWTYVNGGGRWIQVEGMYFFNFTNAAGLVYSAHLTTGTGSRIFGYAVARSDPRSRVLVGTRPRAPPAALSAGPKTPHP